MKDDKVVPVAPVQEDKVPPLGGGAAVKSHQLSSLLPHSFSLCLRRTGQEVKCTVSSA